ncbi:hypothetical protein ACUX4R_28155, partial [Salmonella enterica]
LVSDEGIIEVAINLVGRGIGIATGIGIGSGIYGEVIGSDESEVGSIGNNGFIVIVVDQFPFTTFTFTSFIH